MSRILYGSSNVYRHYSRAQAGLGLNLSLIECTKKAVFDAHVLTLGKLGSGSLIVTSVLANFIADGCRDLGEEESPLFARQQITAHVNSLESLLRECSDTDAVCVIIPPLRRNVPGNFVKEKY